MPDLPTTYIGLIGLCLLGVGGAIWALAQWAGPRITKIIDAFPAMIALQVQQKDILDSLSTSYAVLCRVMSAQHSELARERRQIVIVEDNAVDTRFVTSACTDIARKYRLSVKDVATLEECYGLLSSAIVIVVDVDLPDATIHKLNSVIDLSPSPVIIYSREEIGAEVYPRAFRVLRNNGPQENLTLLLQQALEQAITRSREV